ncbi:HNH endonuclease family protein [Amycolatopsis sp. NPDC089917]|uniref:HNH endonuclease family protein n=1 Tax=Amycolatopsis sp. NPDC089917 TaxID=3155187 RepID=UPI003440ACAA
MVSERWTFARAGVAAVLLASVISCGVPPATPSAPAGKSVAGEAPAVPVAEARKLLGTVQVAVRGVLDGYDRDKFPHWKTVSGRCNVREEVLKRAGENVEVDADCAPTSGSWHSPYDGETWRKASDVDVDHVVPLAHAWVSGAKSWDQARREQFANDLTRPQLLVVTDNVNQEKGDKAPDEWKPPLVSFWCAYATAWIVVKAGYGLSITVPERTALAGMLDRCR